MTTPSSRPWWQTSLVVAVIVMALVGLALSLPPGRATVVLIVGVGVFAWTFWHNPAFWLRRLAGACVSAALVLGAAPVFSAGLKFGSLGAVLVEHGDSTWLALGFLALALALAVLEVVREGPSSPPPELQGPTTHSAGIHAHNHGDVALHAQGNIVGGNVTQHGGQHFHGPVTFAAPAPAPARPVDLDLQRHIHLILDEAEFINIRGISSRLGASRQAIRRPIEELYTPLRTHCDVARDDRPDPRGERVELPELLSRHRHLLLVGQPGSGKSTFLQLVACMLARDLAGRAPPPGAPAWRTRYLGLAANAPAWIPGLVSIAGLVPLFVEHSKSGRADDRCWLLDLLALRAGTSSSQADAGAREQGHAERCAVGSLAS